jgi:hypothetical protein
MKTQESKEETEMTVFIPEPKMSSLWSNSFML